MFLPGLGTDVLSVERHPGTYALEGRLVAKAGRRDDLIAALRDGVAGLLPGCLRYEVEEDPEDAKAVRIIEVWDSVESHRAAQSLPALRKALGRARPLIAKFGDFVEVGSKEKPT
jgi:quinol monooxygenase YgiN